MRTTLLALALGTLLAGCGGGGDDSPTGTGSVTGTYTLRTINGSNLPFTIVQVGADKLEVTAGSVTLNGDGTFSARATHRTTESGVVSIENLDANGTYTQSGNTINFREASGDTYSMALSGTTLTHINSDFGFTLVFRK